MSAREYLPSLGRFLSADSIVPGAGNPQALNRYAYVFNSPLGFVDPSGHDPLDAAWEAAFRAAHGQDPNDNDRHDRLFSLLFCGRGDSCAWTDEDWGFYNQQRAKLWHGENKWFVDDERRDLASFVSRVNKLASYFTDDENASSFTILA